MPSTFERLRRSGTLGAVTLAAAVGAGCAAREPHPASPPVQPPPVAAGTPRAVPATAAAPTAAPVPQPPPPAASRPPGHIPLMADESPAIRRRDEWRHGRSRVYMDDFGELGRYRAANARLGPPAPGESRVVFFGDSITDLWPLADTFPGRPYVNRGISGQTTPQMLVRFRQDVVGLRPKVVVILAGTNDIAGNTGPMTLDETVANLAEMVEIAHLHRIRTVISSVLPVHDYTPQSVYAFPLRPPEKIAELNRALKALAAQTGSVYLDYTTSMSDPRGRLKRDLADDGLHPNHAGYAIMSSLAENAIAGAISAAR